MFNNYEELTKHLWALFSTPNCNVKNGYASIDPKTLYILDNYAVSSASNMTPEIAEKFASSIAMVEELCTVNLYIHRNNRKNKDSLLFVNDKDWGKRKAEYDGKGKKMLETYTNIKRFMKTLERSGKHCNFIVYTGTKQEDRNGLPQKLHGRYWFNDHSGLIVDGSMNSTATNIVLAQELDDVNYGIISKFFDKVICGKNKNICFNLGNIDDAYRKTVALF